MEPLLTLQEVSAILKVKRDAIMNEIKAGRLAGTKVGWLWRFSEKAVADYIASRTIKVKKPKE